MAGQEQDGAGRLNVMIVGQSGRLQYEAILFAVSLALTTPRARLWSPKVHHQGPSPVK